MLKRGQPQQCVGLRKFQVRGDGFHRLFFLEIYIEFDKTGDLNIVGSEQVLDNGGASI